MHLVPILQSLFLLMLANGTPVVAKKVFGPRWAWPLDGGARFIDGRPLLGTSKTIRGIAAALLVTTVGAPAIGLDPWIGAAAATTAMLGDLCSSFSKRRLGMVASSRAFGLDQIPEALFPLLACRAALGLSAVDIALATGAFLIGEIFLSRLLYKAHLRDQPY